MCYNINKLTYYGEANCAMLYLVKLFVAYSLNALPLENVDVRNPQFTNKTSTHFSLINTNKNTMASSNDAVALLVQVLRD